MVCGAVQLNCIINRGVSFIWIALFNMNGMIEIIETALHMQPIKVTLYKSSSNKHRAL